MLQDTALAQQRIGGSLSDTLSFTPDISNNDILSTGSFTGFHKVVAAAQHGYLTQSHLGHHQPLCGNAEGWGPFSPYRYDLTPCALDATVASVAAFGIMFGAGAIYYLLRWRKAQEVKKDVHFWTKQILIALIAVSVVVQAAFQVVMMRDVWSGDFRFWTSILLLGSLGVVGSIQWMEQDRKSTRLNSSHWE